MSKSFDPTEYTPEALEAFAASNEWFNFEDYESDMLRNEEEDEEETLEEQDNRLETCVRVQTRTSTYDQYVSAQEEMFGFTAVEAAPKPPPEAESV